MRNIRKVGWKSSSYARAASRQATQRSAGQMARRGFLPRGLLAAAGELKMVDTSGSPVIDTTGAVLLLNGIAPGSDINQRIGRQVTMKSVEINMLPQATAGTGVDQCCRVLVVYDNQTNSTALTIAQVLETALHNQHYNLENRNRFEVLLDRWFPLNASAEAGSQRTLRLHRKLNHLVTFGAGGAGAIADIITGSVYVCTIGTAAPGATAGTAPFRCRIRYTD